MLAIVQFSWSERRRAYVADSEPIQVVAAIDFFRDNAEGLSPEEMTAIATLQPGESFRGGGGASPVWEVYRLPSPGETLTDPDPGHAVTPRQ